MALMRITLRRKMRRTERAARRGAAKELPLSGFSATSKMRTPEARISPFTKFSSSIFTTAYPKEAIPISIPKILFIVKPLIFMI